MTDRPQTLATRIQQMAIRWQYSPEEREEIKQAAKENYAAVRAFVAHDERVFGQCSTRADFSVAYLKHVARIP